VIEVRPVIPIALTALSTTVLASCADAPPQRIVVSSSAADAGVLPVPSLHSPRCVGPSI